MASTFSVGGLASGLDTNAIIDKLVELESQQLNLLKKRQSGFQAQVSAIGDLASKLSALEAAAQALGTGGAVGVQVASSNTAVSAVPGTGATAGTYAVEVTALASSAKWRSAGLLAADTVRGGTVSFTVQGRTYTTQAFADGSSLATVAAAIRATGAPVAATVLTSGTQSYLSVTSLASGFPVGGLPADALALTHDATGTAGSLLAFAQVQAATNANFTVDGLAFESSSNTTTSAVPGLALTLKARTAPGVPEQLALESDAAATEAKLKTLVDAYNAVNAILQKQLVVAPSADRASMLTGDSTLRRLQASLQSLISTAVPGLGSVRSLADLGLKSGRDGSLSIDSTVLSTALSSDAGAVNAIFSTATTGLSALIGKLVQDHVRVGDGLLTTRKEGLDASLKRLTVDQATWERRIESFRARLVAQFAAMETVVGQLKSTGNFLTIQSNQTKT